MRCNQSRESSDCTKYFFPSSVTAEFLAFFLKFRVFRKQFFQIQPIQFLPVTLIRKLWMSAKQRRPILPI